MLLRDPIHGDIELSSVEATLLDLPVMQRLRGIKQLGTAHLVYPGALHTRFDHAIGVCALAHRIVAGLRRAGRAVSAEEEAAIGAAALLHDITHVPFGHTLEDERRLFPRHDKGARLARLLAGELGEALERLGLRREVGALLGQVGPGAGLSTAEITTAGIPEPVIQGAGMPGPEIPAGMGIRSSGEPVQAMPAWAREIVSGTIDADLLDYLRRDSFFCGLAHDYDDRILRAFAIHDDRLVLRLVKRGMDRPDTRSEIVGVLRLRYFLTERVYYHHTKVVAGAMISKAVELALDGGLLREEELLELNDWTLLDRLARGDQPQAAALARRVLNRDLLKRGYVVSGRGVPLPLRETWVAHYHEDRDERARVERELASALGLPFSEVILYCPALTMMKEANVAVETSRGLARLNDPGQEAFAEIGALQERYAGLWRCYVFVPAQATRRAAAVAGDLFGIPSEYR